MLEKRVIVCLDVKEGKVTKGVKFQNNVDIGDPVELARFYYEAGADELVFYDITASSDKRSIMLDLVDRVAREIFIPFSVGGGISSLEDMRLVINAGAEKISVNSKAVLNPSIITEGAAVFGRQCIVLGMDIQADSTMDSGYRVVINGGRTPTKLDALSWALKAQDLGAGEIVLNSIDADGTKAGYDCHACAMISGAVDIPVVASGGAGNPGHLVSVLREGRADAALIASMVHYGTWTIAEIKEQLSINGLAIRRS